MADEIEEILLDEAAIERLVKELAVRISQDYAGGEVVLVCVLKGAALFCADLARSITVPTTIEFVQAASYGAGRSSSRDVRIKKDLDMDIAGKHVLLVDTIVDSGDTLQCLFAALAARQPASLKAVVLLDKACRRASPVPIAYRGIEIPDRFVVGYGMDCAEKYRALPYIAALKSDSDEKTGQ